MVKEGFTPNGRFIVEQNDDNTTTVGFYFGENKQHYYDTKCESTSEKILLAKQQLAEYAKKNTFDYQARKTVVFDENFKFEDKPFEVVVNFADGATHTSNRFKTIDEAKKVVESFNSDGVESIEIRSWAWDEIQENFSTVWSSEDRAGEKEMRKESVETEGHEDRDNEIYNEDVRLDLELILESSLNTDKRVREYYDLVDKNGKILSNDWWRRKAVLDPTDKLRHYGESPYDDLEDAQNDADYKEGREVPIEQLKKGMKIFINGEFQPVTFVKFGRKYVEVYTKGDGTHFSDVWYGFDRGQSVSIF